MGRRIPPFASIRAFEAVARHRSFTHAAEELPVSRSALSHQVRALEDHLGTLLIYRGKGPVQLTPVGHAYADELATALDMLDQASVRAEFSGSFSTLTIGVFTSFASAWLIPRLNEFHAAHPDVELRLTTLFEKFDYTQQDIDVIIDHRKGAKDGYDCDVLTAEEIFPVCSPDYQRWLGASDDPNVLNGHTLIYHISVPDEWNEWLCTAKHNALKPDRWLQVDTQTHGLDAARSGLGIAMARRPIVNDSLARGEVVAPFAITHSTGYGYYLVTDPSARKRQCVEDFRDWILSLPV
jgi:LysR family glycine cleavage system transcriptional activator